MYKYICPSLPIWLIRWRKTCKNPPKKEKSMDYSKIKLDNERNSHVTKRLNRLNTWKFFKVIYRENIWRMFGYNFLMVVCLAPIFVVLLLGSLNQTSLQQSLPVLNSFGFSTGTWGNLDEYFAARVRDNNMFYGLMAVVASMLVTVILSGGFAVIRDAFWTGKLSTVGVFKSMGKGIKANILYGFVSNVIISFSVFGIYVFFVWMNTIALWAAIVCTVVLGIIALFLTMYLLILCSVSVTYQQSVKQNMSDSWRLMWLNVFPNLIHLLLALIPIALYFVFQNGLFQQLYLIVLLMFGGLYFPLVWHTHMMKTFALFHPVEVKKKKQQKQQQAAAEGEAAEAEATPAEEQDEAGKKPTKSKGKKSKKVTEAEIETDSIADSEADAYAQSDDAYKTDDSKDE